VPLAAHFGPVFEGHPVDCARSFGLELVIERLEVGVVHEYELVARLEIVERFKNEGVLVFRWDRTDVERFLAGRFHCLWSVSA